MFPDFEDFGKQSLCSDSTLQSACVTEIQQFNSFPSLLQQALIVLNKTYLSFFLLSFTCFVDLSASNFSRV